MSTVQKLESDMQLLAMVMVMVMIVLGSCFHFASLKPMLSPTLFTLL